MFVSVFGAAFCKAIVFGFLLFLRGIIFSINIVCVSYQYFIAFPHNLVLFDSLYLFPGLPRPSALLIYRPMTHRPPLYI